MDEVVRGVVEEPDLGVDEPVLALRRGVEGIVVLHVGAPEAVVAG